MWIFTKHTTIPICWKRNWKTKENGEIWRRPFVLSRIDQPGGGAAYLPDTGVADPDHIEECGHDLGQELDALEAQRFKNEGDGLDNHSVVVGERWVSQNAHQGDDGHGGVELIQRQVPHVH